MNTSTLYINELLNRVADLEKRVSSLELKPRSSNHSNKAELISWSEAARIIGISGKNPAAAVRKRVIRERSRPGGVEVRLIHGGCNKADFFECLERWGKRRPSEAADIRRALDEFD